jgi:hypothetical protein
MAIGNAVQQGSFVYIYDEAGRQTGTVSCGHGANDGLKGYTSTTVSIRSGAFIHTYDVNGRQVSTVSA